MRTPETAIEVERVLRLIDATHQRGKIAARQHDFVKAENCVKRAKSLSRRLAELRTGELFR